ncbi:unnamed protein product [Arabidopsis thaliana]|uniref:(thale cress) hypothetical protein n=1 Tax=Arabidopsis thaliana TaxID=3702 RepID=A0A7G2E853_ARATH|nr:unnamed protein product [Arabidopsis thaliana]
MLSEKIIRANPKDEKKNEEQNGDSSKESDGDDGGNQAVDESKYPKFSIGDEYNTIESFKDAINKYSVKKRRDIKYDKSDSKRVVAICSAKKCPWRISASINTSSSIVVIRALNDEHDCTWQAVKDVLPFAEHRMCARHIHANWKKKHSGVEFEDLFWAAAYCYYTVQFDRNMEELKTYSLDAYNDLKIFVFFPWSSVEENNLGESFNATIRIARTKPILEMLEEIRKRVMQIDLAKNCRPLSCGLGNYEVAYFNYKTNMRMDGFIVQLRGVVSCTCRMYLISGIPCSHIISCLRHEKNTDQDPKTLTSPWLTTEKLKRCYLNLMQPVNGMNLWRVTSAPRVKPPPQKKPNGIPPGKKRRRKRKHCSLCGEEGHNKLKCKTVPKPKPRKKPPSRPRKRPFASISEAEPSLPSLPSLPNEVEDLPSLSSALPRKGHGRPRKRFHGFSNFISLATETYRRREEDLFRFDKTIEGYGVFTSPVIGDDYIHLGRSIVDSRDNTILPSTRMQETCCWTW